MSRNATMALGAIAVLYLASPAVVAQNARQRFRGTQTCIR